MQYVAFPLKTRRKTTKCRLNVVHLRERIRTSTVDGSQRRYDDLGRRSSWWTICDELWRHHDCECNIDVFTVLPIEIDLKSRTFSCALAPKVLFWRWRPLGRHTILLTAALSLADTRKPSIEAGIRRNAICYSTWNAWDTAIALQKQLSRRSSSQQPCHHVAPINQTSFNLSVVI